MTPGQIPAIAMAVVSAVIDALAAFGTFNLTDAEKTAILGVASAAVALGVALYAIFSHQAAMARGRGELPRK